MPETSYTSDEMMTIAAARMVRNGAVLFVGIGLPSAAANLALRTHAPETVLIYESGCIGSKPDVLPLSIGDGELAETADAVVIPHWAIGAVCEVKGGAFPSYAHGYYARANAFYKRWDEVSRQRDSFQAWMQRHVMDTKDFGEFRRSLEQVSPERSERSGAHA